MFNIFKIKNLRFFSLIISFSLLIGPLPLSAIAQEIAMDISEVEADVIMQNPDMHYVYLGKDRSNIADIISQLSDWDEELNSPLHKLHNHINEGFSIAEYDSVMEALEYAESIIYKNHKKLPQEHIEKIVADLDEIMDKITIDESA